MDIHNLITGLLLFVITSVLIYIFNRRQLYITSRTLYNTSFLSKKGFLVEILIYNRGNEFEKNIEVTLNSKLKYEMVAKSLEGIKIENNNLIVLEKLYKDSSVTLLLLIENGEFSSKDITDISSADVQGSVFPNTESIPPNFRKMSMLMISFIVIGIFIYNLDKAYIYFEKIKIENDYKYIIKKGWENLSDYGSSEFSKSYSYQEFPIRYMAQYSDGDVAILAFEVINKSAIPIVVHFSGNGKIESKNFNKDTLKFNVDKIVTLNFNVAEISPNAKETILFFTQKANSIVVDISITHGSESIHGITRTISLAKLNKKIECNPDK